MQAKDFYEIGKRAYNGDEQARIELEVMTSYLSGNAASSTK